MDTSKKTYTRDDRPDSDADLNLLLYKAGKSVKDLLLRIWRGVENILKAVILIFLHLFRNIGWLLLGFLLGIGLGIYFLSSQGSNYVSEMTVKANFNSVPSLYSSVEYFNSLISSNKAELSKVFNLAPDQVNRIRSFSISPVKSEIITADLYNELFMKNDRAQHVRQDTFWLRTIRYDDFKKSLSDQDYPFQKITVVTNSPTVYTQIQDGILRHISNNKLLKDVKDQHTQTNLEEEKLLSSSISNLDSLRIAYNERLVKQRPANDLPSTQMTVLQNGSEIKAPELELYDKMLELKDELKKVRNRAVTEKEIIDVYSPFNTEGKKVTFIQSIWKYALLGLELAAGILILRLLYTSLVTYDFSVRNKKRVTETRDGI